MKEELLSYIWRYRLWDQSRLKTTEGESVEIIDTGRLNTDAGPDYFNAKIKIGDTTWAGNIELHVKASDWNLHNHQTDPAYNSIILHVVARSDCYVKNQKGDTVPQMELPISQDFINLARQLVSSDRPIACARYWNSELSRRLQLSLSSLVCERIEAKMEAIEKTLKQNHNNWEDTFYQVLARSFGMKVNAEPFELLARSLPQTCLAKQKSDIVQIEAMLLGQAGLLSAPIPTDEYIDKLITEYKFLSSKYQLTPMNRGIWKMARMRPANSPYVRLSQFAQLIYKSEHLFSHIMATNNYKELQSIFTVEATEYWRYHFYPAQASPQKPKHVGVMLCNSILINCVVPVMFAYGRKTGNEEKQEQAIELLTKIAPEENAIVSQWLQMGITVHSAHDTQALIQQQRNYCEKRDCLRCRIGYQIFKMK